MDKLERTERKLLTVAEAASMLGISRALMYRLILDERRVRSIVIGERTRRVPVSALDEFIAQELSGAEGSIRE